MERLQLKTINGEMNLVPVISPLCLCILHSAYPASSPRRAICDPRADTPALCHLPLHPLLDDCPLNLTQSLASCVHRLEAVPPMPECFPASDPSAHSDRTQVVQPSDAAWWKRRGNAILYPYKSPGSLFLMLMIIYGMNKFSDC